MADKPNATKMAELSESDDMPPPSDANDGTVPLSQLNWFKWLNVSDAHDASVVEYPLYSDAHITSEFREGLGPYSFLNTVPTFQWPRHRQCFDHLEGGDTFAWLPPP